MLFDIYFLRNNTDYFTFYSASTFEVNIYLSTFFFSHKIIKTRYYGQSKEEQA